MNNQDLKKLEELIQEDGKTSHFKIPESILREIIAFQKAFRRVTLKKISREKVLILMMIWATDELLYQTGEMEEMIQNTEAQAKEAEKFNSHKNGKK